MREVEALLDEVFTRQERLSRDEIHRRAVAADAPVEVMNALDELPEGEYAQDEVADAVGQLSGEPEPTPGAGVPSSQLTDEELLRELRTLHRTRHDTLRHGSDQALETHTERMAELEAEYLRRVPEREVDPERLRAGARDRWELRTGADQPWDPEDFAVAVGRDPTPENVEWARGFLAEHGASAIERIVP